MHPKTVKKVLGDEETLDIAATAEAVREDLRLRGKTDKPKSKANSAKAHAAWTIRQHEKEAWRQKLKEAWNKHKQV